MNLNRRLYASMNWLIILMLTNITGMAGKNLFADTLYVGMAQVDITPPDEYAHYRGVGTGVDDPLFAKAVVFEEGENLFAWVECDLLWISRGLSVEVRRKVKEETGIPIMNMVIAATHTHTSPAYEIGILELNEDKRPDTYEEPRIAGKLDYLTELTEGIVRAIIEAYSTRVPAVLEVGTGEIEGISFNRRAILAGGIVKMNGGVGNPDIVGKAGPVDPSLGIIMVRAAENQYPMGCIVNFGLHADTYGGTKFSADYPGFLERNFQDKYGKDFVSFFANGPCGDINHINVEKGSERLTSEMIGDRLFQGVIEELPYLQKIKNPDLSVRSKYVYIPMQGYTEEEWKWTKTMDLDSLYNADFLEFRRATKINSLARFRRTGEAIPPTTEEEGTWRLPCEIQVLRIGKETAIVGLPGEVFAGLGLAIREASPFKHTLISELSNNYIAYVPTEEAFQQGSYETINSRLAPGGGEMLVEEAVELLKELYHSLLEGEK